jgi:hypothetical protein
MKKMRYIQKRRKVNKLFFILKKKDILKQILLSHAGIYIDNKNQEDNIPFLNFQHIYGDNNGKELN